MNLTNKFFSKLKKIANSVLWSVSFPSEETTNSCPNVRFVLQLGTLGAGNHYAEIQVVDDIYDKHAAKKMGIDRKGQVCVMVHCGSRGLGHQVATGKPDAVNYLHE